MFVQRLSSVPNEREAEKAALSFVIFNYVIRTWPWIVVALAALVVLPPLADPELAYPAMMLRYLPSGLLGLVFASLLAAFMSTVSTQVNWGASYAVRDLYQRFADPRASQARLVAAARVASVLITILAAAFSFWMDDIGTVFRFLVLVGNGTGAVLLLRWFWWRVNAWAEWTALVTGTTIAVLLTVVPALAALTFGTKLVLTAFGTMAIWVPVMLLTPPEPAEALDEFYRHARVGGPGWRTVRARTGVAPASPLGRDSVETAAVLAQVLGATLALGGLVVASWAWGLGGSAAVVAGWVVRRRMRARVAVEP
jgi:Na+/proline symporter